MRQRILCLLSSRKSDLKRKWAERLRAQPVSTAMAEPAILSHLMDETLEQLVAQLSRRAMPKTVRERRFDNRCRCGLNPLLAYFGTGEVSVVEMLAEEATVEEPLQTFVRAQWQLLAQREIDALCSACVRTCASPYPKAAGRASSLSSVGGYDRDK